MMKKLMMLMVVVILAVFAADQVFAKPIEIHWWHAMRGARGETLKKIVDAFNASQSDFVVVETNKGNYDETVNAGVAAYRAKKHPHILQSFEVGTLTMMLSGAIYPVYKLMADQGYQIDWSSYLQPVLSYYVDENENLLSMPFNSSTPVMYYNVDLFKKAGIDLPSKTEPLTWDQMGDITAKLVASGVKKGMVTSWQSWTQVENYSAIHDLPFASKANGYEGLDCELQINNAQVVNHLSRLKSWMADNRFSYEGQKYQGPQAAFVGGDAAILMESISGIGNVKKNAQFAWDLAPLPVEASMKEPQNSIIGGASLWVMQGHPKKDYKGVAAFMDFLAQNDMQELWHMETGYFPITITAYESLKKKGYFDENPYQEVGINQMTRRKPTKNSRGLRLGYFVQIRNIINEEMELLWNGSKSPQQAMDDAVSRSNEKLREFEKTYK
ncbi:sn-glycerol-3-phosphate ABC transporter substrate-binding protein UgpB [Desulfosarcina sp.]|uniref:sn-glycerol-3-phosphate ABC transporter substrate-binding protein UgpB n=1 Tax=Desulfosarcina sp. TaxID=2027861 RepID=UPI0035683EEF